MYQHLLTSIESLLPLSYRPVTIEHLLINGDKNCELTVSSAQGFTTLTSPSFLTLSPHDTLPIEISRCGTFPSKVQDTPWFLVWIYFTCLLEREGIRTLEIDSVVKVNGRVLY